MDVYTILIVDDEPYIVNGLHDLCSDLEGVELDIFCAYSSAEAVRRLQSTKIDIVITDIQMPGMSGLELTDIIQEWWPRTKIIFLTGHGSFDYAQTALRQQAVDFLLKTESEEKITLALRKAIRQCAEDTERSRLVANANERLQQAMPALRKAFFMQLVQGEAYTSEYRARKFAELQIPMDAAERCLLVAGRVDDWRDAYNSFDKSLLLYAIQNIAEEFVCPSVRFQAVICNTHDFIWFVQPIAPDGGSGAAAEAWTRAVLFVQGTIASIQSTCKSLLKQSVSIAAGSAPVEWERVAGKYRELTRMLSRGLGSGGEMLIVENESEAQGTAAHEARERPALSALGQADMLDRLLDGGKREEFRRLAGEMFAAIPPEASDWFKEAYYTVALRLFSCMNRWRAQEAMRASSNTDWLLQYERHATDTEAIRYLLETADALFERRSSEQTERTNDLVLRLHRYIETHLSEDVSLTRLGDELSLNPSYLCRLYKQITGGMLSEHIAHAKINRAKELLVGTSHRIHEIGKAIGYDSPAYFSRFFKKYTELTPQEYRDRFQAGSSIR